MRTRRDTGYKDDRMHSLVLSTPAEPLNAMSAACLDEQRAKPVLQPRRDLNPRREGAVTGIIPVIAANGQPLIPCKPAKAKRLLKRGLAEKRWSKLGQFYLQLKFDPQSQPNQEQELWLADDPGSKYDGLAIASEQQVQTTAMLELPTGIAEKLENRRQLRRARRYRNCRRRPARFDNRKTPAGWIAPSQKAKVEFRLKVIRELCKLYPVSGFLVEDVKFDHYRKRWGKSFSTVEIGKTHFYNELKKLGHLKLYEGWETHEERERQGLHKSKAKSKRSPESHAVDAVAMLSRWLGTIDLRIPEFRLFKLPNLRRRSLHLQNPVKGGIRRVHGGTVALGIPKNTVCVWREQLYRTGGSTKDRLSLHDMSLEAKRVTQNAKIADLNLLFRQTIFAEEVAHSSVG